MAPPESRTEAGSSTEPPRDHQGLEEQLNQDRQQGDGAPDGAAERRRELTRIAERAERVERAHRDRYEADRVLRELGEELAQGNNPAPPTGDQPPPPLSDEEWVRQAAQDLTTNLRRECREYLTEQRAKGNHYPDMTRFAAVWDGPMNAVVPVAITPSTIVHQAMPKKQAAWKEVLSPVFDASSQSNFKAFMYAFRKVTDRGQYDEDCDWVIIAERNFEEKLQTQWQRHVEYQFGTNTQAVLWRDCYEWMQSQLPPERVRTSGPIHRLKELTQGDMTSAALVEEMLDIQEEAPFDRVIVSGSPGPSPL
jgi:hypothetical protein